MKLAIMQPYIFPYIGYFHLIDSVDTFVFYDDVNFVNSGWVNRNKILVNNKEFLFTVPSDWSQNKKINEIFVTTDYKKWQKKFLSTLKHTYGKEKFFKETSNLIEKTLSCSENLNDICKTSIINTLEYLEIEKNIIHSSDIFKNENLKSNDRIKDICKKSKADVYINTSGGKALYSKEDFAKEFIQLYFIKSKENLNFLSIIDTMMKHGKDTKKFIKEYEIE
jgi:hypothetical protein